MAKKTAGTAPGEESDESIDLGYLPDGAEAGGIPADVAPIDDDLAEALLEEGVDVLVLGDNDPNADIASLSYEDARDQLITVVARLEAGGESLENALALWERGEALAARCQEWLDGAQAKLSEATNGSGDG